MPNSCGREGRGANSALFVAEVSCVCAGNCANRNCSRRPDVVVEAALDDCGIMLLRCFLRLACVC
jgi:hypothetical protein